MVHLIDKSALVAKINHHLQFTPEHTNAFIEGEEHAYRTILSFIDTLEVKEVDFERELSKYVSQGIHRFFPNEDNDYYNIDSVEWQDYVIDTAKHFFDLGLKAKDKGKKLLNILHPGL